MSQAPHKADSKAPLIQQTPQTNGRSYWLLFVLFLVSVLNLLDRNVINILAQDIKTELLLTDTQLGLLTGTAFGLFYSILGIPLGRLADRVNRIRLIAAAMTLWSAFTIFCGFASGFIQLFLARVGVGVGEAGSQPASTTLIPDHFPPEHRGGAMSLLMLGAPVGSFLGMYLGGLAGSIWGWRTAFILAGIPGLFLAVLLLITLKDPRAQGAVRTAPPPMMLTLIGLWGDVRLRTLAVYLACATFAIYATSAWLPAYFVRVHDAQPEALGSIMGIALGIGGGVGVLGSGFLCDYLRKRFGFVEHKVLLATTILSVPFLLATLFLQSMTLIAVALFFFYVFAFAYLSPAVTLVQQFAAVQTRAFAVAICISLANIASLVVGMPLVGLLSDALSEHSGSMALGHALGGLLLVTALVSLVSLWWSYKHSQANVSVA